jgi:hypothetical protein
MSNCHQIPDVPCAASQILPRPVHEGKRVTLCNLCEYHEKYQFLGPCCLCPLLGGISDEPAFTEAAIYMPIFGHYGGEYVMECVKSQCRYLGQSSSLLELEADIHTFPMTQFL